MGERVTNRGAARVCTLTHEERVHLHKRFLHCKSLIVHRENKTADMTLHQATLKIKRLKKKVGVVEKCQAPIPSLTCERPAGSPEPGTSAWPRTR